MGFPLKLYLRQELSTDPHTLAVRAHYRPGRFPKDVVAYRDPECRERVGRWPWHYSTKPHKNSRRVTFNCYEYAAVWLPEKEV